MAHAGERIAFAGGVLDRAGDRRTDEAWLAAVRRDPRARAVVVGRGGAGPALVTLCEDDDAIFLGLGEDGPVFAVERDAGEVVGLREAAASLGGAHVGLLAYASALAHWARTTRFCGVCGEPTAAREGGHLRVCANGHHHHPRTDPVVIVLVSDGDRAMLGRQPAWPAGRYSALAGFVEPGEALEDAVAREVREEAGVDVADVRFVASQPWPFPASLMLGFHARHVAGEPAPRDDELEDVRWFSRGEIAGAARDDVDWLGAEGPEGRLLLPPRIAIARLLIERWLAGS